MTREKGEGGRRLGDETRDFHYIHTKYKATKIKPFSHFLEIFLEGL